MMQYPETKINAEDKFNNKLDLENFKSYSIGDKKIFCYLKTGQTLELNYDSNEKASEIYEKYYLLKMRQKDAIENVAMTTILCNYRFFHK